MASASITIRGLREVSRAFERMDRAAALKIIRRAFRRALIPVRDRTRTLAPHKTGALAGSAKILSGRTRKGLVSVRVVIGKGAYRGDQFYGSMQEFGWKVGSRKLGDKRRSVPPRHFMRQALEEEGPSAKDKAEEYIWDEIQNLMKAK